MVSDKVYFQMAQKMLEEERFVEALGFYRLAKMVAAGKMIVPFATYDFVAPICDFSSWSARNGFSCHSEIVENAFPERWYFDALPPRMTEFYRNSRLRQRKIHLCRAHDVCLMQWVFPSGDVTCAFFSSTGDLLSDDFYGNRQWLKHEAGHSHLRCVDSETRYAIVDFCDKFNNCNAVYENCFFLWYKPNYGHWLLDFVPRLWFLERFPELRDLPLVVGRLQDFHRETLQLFGVRNELIELVPEKKENGTYLITEFKDVVIPSRIPASLSREFFERKVDDLLLAVGASTEPSGRRRLYLSRKNLAPRHHVENEDEVAAYLQREGFEILYPEQMTVFETIKKCREAEIVVSPPGAQSSNLLFTKGAVFVDLVARDTPFWHMSNLRSWSEYIFPLVEHYLPVWCEPVEEEVSSPFDTLLRVNIADLRAALLKAEAVLRSIGKC